MEIAGAKRGFAQFLLMAYQYIGKMLLLKKFKTIATGQCMRTGVP